MGTIDRWIKVQRNRNFSCIRLDGHNDLAISYKPVSKLFASLKRALYLPILSIQYSIEALNKGLPSTDSVIRTVKIGVSTEILHASPPNGLAVYEPSSAVEAGPLLAGAKLSGKMCLFGQMTS